MFCADASPDGMRDLGDLAAGVAGGPVGLDLLGAQVLAGEGELVDVSVEAEHSAGAGAERPARRAEAGADAGVPLAQVADLRRQ